LRFTTVRSRVHTADAAVRFSKTPDFLRAESIAQEIEHLCRTRSGVALFGMDFVLVRTIVARAARVAITFSVPCLHPVS